MAHPENSDAVSRARSCCNTCLLVLGDAKDPSDNIGRISKDCGYVVATPEGWPECSKCRRTIGRSTITVGSHSGEFLLQNRVDDAAVQHSAVIAATASVPHDPEEFVIEGLFVAQHVGYELEFTEIATVGGHRIQEEPEQLTSGTNEVCPATPNSSIFWRGAIPKGLKSPQSITLY